MYSSISFYSYFFKNKVTDQNLSQAIKSAIDANKAAATRRARGVPPPTILPITEMARNDSSSGSLLAAATGSKSSSGSDSPGISPF